MEKTVTSNGLATPIKYALVSGLSTAIEWGSFALLSAIGVGLFISQATSYLAAMANSYFINRCWTFKTTEPVFSKALLRYILLNAAMLGLSTAILWALYKPMGIDKMWAKIISSLICLLISFLANKLWVFAKKDN